MSERSRGRVSKRLVMVVLTAALVLGLAAPASAFWWNKAPKADNVVETLVNKSGTGGPDSRWWDYDLLIAAASNVTVDDDGTTVADVLASTGDITLWAPNDAAFKRLATALGGDGSSEASAGAFLLGLPNDTLLAVLTYHVTPEGLNVFEVLGQRTFDTLNGETITRSFLTLIDQDPDARNAKLRLPLNLKSADGSVVHTVNQVLRPIDL